MTANFSPPHGAISCRQMIVTAIVMSLLLFVAGVVFWNDRHQEWRLRESQAAHRLDLVSESITRDLSRVRSDVLYIAGQSCLQNFVSGLPNSRRQVENEFANFLTLKQTYQQIRLLDETGREAVRVDLLRSGIQVVPEHLLQDKSDRYYFQESMKLNLGELFISEFDLNQERGVIEKPLNPVIRFVTPVVFREMATGDPADSGGAGGQKKYLLVANYKGKPLLDDMKAIALSGRTYLIRNDGQFLLGPEPDDAWGWLLGHEESLSKQFPDAWDERLVQDDCKLLPSGAFSFRSIDLNESETTDSHDFMSNQLVAVSHLPANEVFATSRQLLYRLLLLVLATLLPVLLLTRFWAVASLKREFQNNLITASEQKLRELSSRLIRLQEEERRAISREIHDQLGQQATAINLDLKLALREATNNNVRSQLKRTVAESEQLVSTLHDFATRIRPVEIDDLGLFDALESHVWDFKERTGIDVNFESNLQGQELPTAIAENVYRLIQESLNNVLKHAQATSVEISAKILCDRSSATDRLYVLIRDDGVGQLEAPLADGINGTSLERTKLGILGMRERVDLLNGELKFESVADRGTVVEVLIPVPKTS